MKRYILTFAAAIAAFLLTGCDDEEKRLIGAWVDSGGIVWTFHSDHTLTLSELSSKFLTAGRVKEALDKKRADEIKITWEFDAEPNPDQLTIKITIPDDGLYTLRAIQEFTSGNGMRVGADGWEYPGGPQVPPPTSFDTAGIVETFTKR